MPILITASALANHEVGSAQEALDYINDYSRKGIADLHAPMRCWVEMSSESLQKIAEEEKLGSILLSTDAVIEHEKIA